MFNIKLLSLCLLFAAGLLSCEKKEEESTMVELLSFGPTGVQHGDTLRFIGNNLHRVTEIRLTGATVPQSAFIKQEREEIQIKVPVTTERGLVRLITPEGEIVSRSPLNLEVVATVTSVTDEALPGTDVTITGDYLNWVSRVTFARDKVVSTFKSQSKNQIVLTVPMDAQTGPLVLFYTGTDSGDVQSPDTLKVTLPAITGLAPTLLKHADDLTITGTNLNLVKSVSFTGHSTPITTFTVNPAGTALVVKVPAGTTKGKISITALSGVMAPQSAQEIDLIMPAITSFNPNPTDTLVNLTISGTNLDLVSGIVFTGVTTPVTSFVSQSPTDIVVQVPAKARRGRPVLQVKNSTRTVLSGQILRFTFDPPALADFTLAIYTDVLQNGFQDWSWATKDFNSSANVREGDKSIKATYGGDKYQGITFHHGGSGVSTAGYTTLEFSVFGEAGTGGKQLNMITNGNWGSQPKVTITEGAWTTFSVPLTTLGSPAMLTELILQANNFTGVVHIDHVGLR